MNPQDEAHLSVLERALIRAERELVVEENRGSSLPFDENNESPPVKSEKVQVCEKCAELGSCRFDGVAEAYTICEVRKHSSANDCWIVSGEWVYNVTRFLGEHPGGIKSILRRSRSNKDCTEDFHFHSRDAQKTWNKMRYGKLVPCHAENKDKCSIC